MKRLQNHLIGVDRGETSVFSDFEDGGPMWTGTGPRQAIQPVRFSEPYRSAPVVHLSLSMWDIGAETNPRVDVSAQNITHEGFEIVFRTWGDSQIARARASWLAIGELTHEDDWDVS